MFQQPISASHKTLLSHTNALHASGGTALGPGLLSAVAAAGEGMPGSMVILCTDGCASNGLGRFRGDS